MARVIVNPVHEDELQMYPKKTGEFVAVSGDTMTGELDMQSNAIILKASNGTRYKVTVEDGGNLKTSPIATTPIGSPWLFLFGNI